MADRAIRLTRRAAAWALAAGLVLPAFVVLPGCDGAGPGGKGFHSIDITGAEYAQALELTDSDGKRRTLAEFKGKVTVVFFGYTQCPDVCPTTMAELAQVRAALGSRGDALQVVFVTLDPERDTAEVLKAYAANFGPGVLALRGSAEETAAVAKAFKIFYAKVPGKTEGSYTLDHVAGSYVYDKQGRVRLFTRYGMGAELLRNDLQRLIDERG